MSHERLRVYRPEIQSLDSAAAPAIKDERAVAHSRDVQRGIEDLS